MVLHVARRAYESGSVAGALWRAARGVAGHAQVPVVGGVATRLVDAEEVLLVLGVVGRHGARVVVVDDLE